MKNENPKSSDGPLMRAWENWVIPIFWIVIFSGVFIPFDIDSDIDLIARLVVAVILTNILHAWQNR